MDENVVYFSEDETLIGLILKDHKTMLDANKNQDERKHAEARFFKSIALLHANSKIEAEMEKQNFEKEKLEKELELEREKRNLEKERLEKEHELEREKLKHEAEIEKERTKTEKLKTGAKVLCAGLGLGVGGFIAYQGYKVNLDSVNTMKETTSLGTNMVTRGLFSTLF